MINLQEEIVGTLLTFPEEIHNVLDILSPEEFTGQYRQVVEEMTKSESADVVSISATTGVPASNLANWMEGHGSRYHLRKYCEQLRDRNTRQRIARIASDLVGMAEESTAEQMIEFAESSLLEVAPKGKSEPRQVGDALAEVFAGLEERYKNRGRVVGITTGIAGLDRATNGLQVGKLYAIAGRPGMGKTAIAINLAMAAAKNAGQVLFFSMEMLIHELIERMIAAEGGVKYSALASGNMKDSDWSRMTTAATGLQDLQFAVDDTSSVSIQHIKTQARQMQVRRGLKMVVVDYLTLMDMPDGPQRSAVVGTVTRGLKRLAKDLGIPVVILCQLSRKVDERTDKRPIMSDLRDSGEIEQDCDVIMFPFRECEYCQQCRNFEDNATHNLEKHQRKAEIIIGKNRGGQRNVSIPCEFHGEHQRFVDANREDWEW
jgi:replicative DNA helicase